MTVWLLRDAGYKGKQQWLHQCQLFYNICQYDLLILDQVSFRFFVSFWLTRVFLSAHPRQSRLVMLIMMSLFILGPNSWNLLRLVNMERQGWSWLNCWRTRPSGRFARRRGGRVLAFTQGPSHCCHGEDPSENQENHPTSFPSTGFPRWSRTRKARSWPSAHPWSRRKTQPDACRRLEWAISQHLHHHICHQNWTILLITLSMAQLSMT